MRPVLDVLVFVAALAGLGSLVAGPERASAQDVTVSGQVWSGDAVPALPICVAPGSCETLTYLGPFGPTSSPPAGVPVTFFEDSIGELVSVTDDEIIIEKKGNTGGGKVHIQDLH